MGGSSIIKTLFYLLLFSSLASRSRSEPRVLPFFLLFDRELSWITRDPDTVVSEHRSGPSLPSTYLSAARPTLPSLATNHAAKYQIPLLLEGCGRA
jgi:hypothetical protein